MIDATLCLEDGFRIIGHRIDYKRGIFPGGEVYINVDTPNARSVRINARIRNSNHLMELILATDALRRQGVQWIELFLPYLPYSRQDRVCEQGDSFSLKTICQILSCVVQYNQITTFDNHSNVAEVLLDNLVNIPNHQEVFNFMDEMVLSDVILIAPDQGASKKAQELFDADDNDRIKDVVFCIKKRTKGGNVEIGLPVKGLKKEVCLVVDDICDGGRTFTALAKKLQISKTHSNYLFVSHGIFSAGLANLYKYYKHIGTTNSYIDNYAMSVKKINLQH
jgi:ribose-phosphate pyrophosphokinase